MHTALQWVLTPPYAIPCLHEVSSPPPRKGPWGMVQAEYAEYPGWQKTSFPSRSGKKHTCCVLRWCISDKRPTYRMLLFLTTKTTGKKDTYLVARINKLNISISASFMYNILVRCFCTLKHCTLLFSLSATHSRSLSCASARAWGTLKAEGLLGEKDIPY